MEAEEKKINLRTLMAAKIIPALFALGFYWMCVRPDYHQYYFAIQCGLFCAMMSFIAFLRKKRDVFDESAQRVMAAVDSFSIKAAYVIMALVLMTTFITDSSVITGYCLVMGIVVLTIIRAIMFYILDKRGM